MNVSMDPTVRNHLKCTESQMHEGCIHQCNIYEKSFMNKRDPGTHVEGMHDVTTQENYQNFCICTDITVPDKCLYRDGYL